VSSEEDNYEQYNDNIGDLTPVDNPEEERKNDKLIQTDLNKRVIQNHEAFFQTLNNIKQNYKTLKNEKNSLESVDTQLSKKYSENTKEMLQFPHESNECSVKMILRSFKYLPTDNDRSFPAEDENNNHPKKEDDQVKPCLFSSDDVGTAKPIMRWSESLKTCRTPPSNTSYPKQVR
jgi:hypothetical protein